MRAFKAGTVAAAVVFATLTAVHAMGPDPGGHTGDKVTPQTTKTDRPEIDSRREQASGNRTETNAPPASGSRRD